MGGYRRSNQWQSVSSQNTVKLYRDADCRGSEYVSQATALAENLTYATDTSFVMRADSSTTLNATGPGRKSNRIKSNAQYNTHVAV